MAFLYEISGFQIPAGDVLVPPDIEENLSYDIDGMYPDTLKLELSNIDKSRYDDKTPGSFFYGGDFENKILTITNEETGIIFWSGYIKNLETSSKRIKITSVNMIDRLKNTCIYDNSSSPETIAMAMYNLITGSANGGIPANMINYSGFLQAHGIHDVNQAYVQLKFTQENGVSIMAVLNELQRISQCHLYTRNNVLQCFQWTQWAGEPGITRIQRRHLTSGEITTNYEVDEVYTKYLVKYKSGTAVTSISGVAAGVPSIRGKSWNVPDEDDESTVADEYRILLTTQVGSQWCADQAMARMKRKRCFIEMEVSDYLLDELKPGDQIDLDFESYKMEPTRIVGRKATAKNRTSKIKGEFLNFPYEYYPRDDEAPDPVELITMLCAGDGVMIMRWTKSDAIDWAGYRVYFTTTLGEWFRSFSGEGPSPIDNKDELPDALGNIQLLIRQLTPTIYYGKVGVYDQVYNESEPSNIKTCRVYRSSVTGAEQWYMCTGHVLTGVVLDPTNPREGVPPSEYIHYDEVNYDEAHYELTAIYTSSVLESLTGFKYIQAMGIGDPGDLIIQYRFHDGTSFGEWSEEMELVGTMMFDFTDDPDLVTGIQFRVFFHSTRWSDPDRFLITDIQEN